MDNIQIANIFRQIAKILEIKNDNPFRIRAYTRAAMTLESLGENVKHYVNTDGLESLAGIGKDLSAKIKELVATGKLKFYDDLKKSLPEGLLDMLDVPSLGPKTVSALYQKLHIKDIDDLERAARSGALLKLEGIREKTVANILAGIELIRKRKERMSLGKALVIAEDVLEQLSKQPQLKKILYAGSLRRMKETVQDIDILAVSEHPKGIIDSFSKIDGVKRILAQGDTKASIMTGEDIQVDLRVVPAQSSGAALLYFTGSKNFNIKLRQLALKKDLKINEYGVFSVKGKKEKMVAGKTEEEIFKLLKLAYVEPELREDRGEVELALKNQLPKLLQFSDIKGDLHVHSNFSDGQDSILEMAQAAKKKGYQYLAITDHSQSLRIAGGLKPADLRRKKKEIDKVNAKVAPLRLLYGTEVDIDNEGKLDYPQAIIEEFEVVVAAIHTGFKQSKKQLTQRIIRACENKHVNVIAHPTGKLWGVRAPYDVDLEAIFQVARDTNTALEINAFPDRLDLNDINCHQAKEYSAKVCINTDSHQASQLAFMRLGVATARRGWLDKKDCINTYAIADLLKFLKK
jgi:DNA polymerase (family 10)